MSGQCSWGSSHPTCSGHRVCVCMCAHKCVCCPFLRLRFSFSFLLILMIADGNISPLVCECQVKSMFIDKNQILPRLSMGPGPASCATCTLRAVYSMCLPRPPVQYMGPVQSTYYTQCKGTCTACGAHTRSSLCAASGMLGWSIGLVWILDPLCIVSLV